MSCEPSLIIRPTRESAIICWQEADKQLSGLIKADLHVHTCYSRDCATSLPQIVARCVELGLGCVAIADHNTISGALKLKEMAPFKVIVAEEIMTTSGELMGLFLADEIAPGLPAAETIARIKDQGGLIAIPHPFGRSPLQNSNRLLSAEILSRVDIIEVFNSRTPFRNSSTRAWRLALEHRLATSAGSDAHTVREIGRAYVEMPDFDGPGGFLDSLSRGRIFEQRSSPLVHFATTWVKIRKRFGDKTVQC